MKNIGELEKVKETITNGNIIIESTYLEEKAIPIFKKEHWWSKKKIWITELPKFKKLISRKITKKKNEKSIKNSRTNCKRMS